MLDTVSPEAGKEVRAEPPTSAASGTASLDLDLSPCFLVGVIIGSHHHHACDARRRGCCCCRCSRVFIRSSLLVEVFQAFIVEILDRGERVHDSLLSDGSRDAREEEEARLEYVVGFDDGDVAIVAGCAGCATDFCKPVNHPRLQGAVIVSHEFVVSLGFDVLEDTEEDAGSETVFKEGEAPAGEDASHADVLQFALCVCPHTLVLIMFFAVLESDL